MKVRIQIGYSVLLAVLCFVVGCGPKSPQVSLSKQSPDGKYWAELVEKPVGGIFNGDRHFEVRITPQNTNSAQPKMIYRSPDVGSPSERFLWSDDSRYLLLVGKSVCVGPESVADSGEYMYLLYDLETRELRCNEEQLDTPMKRFDFNDLSGINFGEKFKPAKREPTKD